MVLLEGFPNGQMFLLLLAGTIVNTWSGTNHWPPINGKIVFEASSEEIPWILLSTCCWLGASAAVSPTMWAQIMCSQQGICFSDMHADIAVSCAHRFVQSKVKVASRRLNRATSKGLSLYGRSFYMVARIPTRSIKGEFLQPNPLLLGQMVPVQPVLSSLHQSIISLCQDVLCYLECVGTLVDLCVQR